MKKNPRDMTAEERKNIKMEFAPGCFDNFDGTQEELDELIKGIQDMILSGEIFEKGRPLDIDELIEEEPEVAEKLIQALSDEPPKRNLQ